MDKKLREEASMEEEKRKSRSECAREKKKAACSAEGREVPYDISSIGACRPRIFFINGFLFFLEDE